MARKTVTTKESHSVTNSQYHSESKSQSKTQSQSATSKVLDEALRDKILAGLMGYMTDEEIDAYARNLLEPQKNAESEAAQRIYEQAKLSGEQEIENLTAALARSVKEQEKAYKQNMADVETAALARGMGRSSYTMETLANQGKRLSEAVSELTEDNRRETAQAQSRISQAAAQKAQTQARLETDYAKNLAAKVQELKESQRREYNQNYMSAVTGSMGTSTTGSSETQGSSVTDTVGRSETNSSSISVTKTSGSGGGGSKSSDQVDAISGAAQSVKYRK